MSGRRFLLALAFVTLLLAVLAGLARLGYAVGPAREMAVWHSLLMSGGFAGLLISLERAVALERLWGYAAPLSIVAGSAGILAGNEAALWLYVLGGVFALLVQIQLARRRFDMASLVMALGTLCWGLGMLAFALRADLALTVLAWANFPVLVIAGERLELAFGVPSGGRSWWLFVLAVAACLFGPVAYGIWGSQGAFFSATGWLLLALWMLRYDILRRGYAQGGQARFMSLALWTGYAWLVAAGLLLALWAAGYTSAWDGAIHALFLGFMFSMIFAHAPVIFPAVSGIAMRWHRGHYAQLWLMAAALLLRIGAGMSSSSELKREAALCNALALLVFLINQIISSRLARQTETHYA